MPTYDYACKQCKHGFEELVFAAEQVACPRCGSQRVQRQPNACSVGSGGSIPSEVIDAARLSAGGSDGPFGDSSGSQSGS